MAEQLRVATFNIRTSRGRDGRNRWSRRHAACLAAIRNLAADVVGLQEVRPDQLDSLRTAFPDATIVGSGRDEDGGGEHASILIAADTWVVEATETRWLSPTPDRAGSRGWDAALPRIVTLVRLRRGGVTLGVANTHFDHAGAEARRRSAGLLTEWLAEGQDRPWIVLGDLNDRPGSAPLRALAAAGYRDSLPDDAGGTEHAFTGSLERDRIDYVLTGAGVRVEAAWIGHECPDGRLPSDHWPVLAELIIS